MFQLLPTNATTYQTDSRPQNPMDSPSSLLLLYGFEASLPSIIPEPLPHQTSTGYDNLATQKLLYDWHICLGHMNYATIQSLACKDIGIPCVLAKCSPPSAANANLEKQSAKPQTHWWATASTRWTMLHQSDDHRLPWTPLHDAWSSVLSLLLNMHFLCWCSHSLHFSTFSRIYKCPQNPTWKAMIWTVLPMVQAYFPRILLWQWNLHQ